MTGETVVVPLIDERAAAARLGVSPATMRLWRSQGKGPAFVRGPRMIRYDQRDLDAWIAAHRVGKAV